MATLPRFVIGGVPVLTLLVLIARLQRILAMLMLFDVCVCVCVCCMRRYTMDILNKEKGPNLFWAICIVCVAINIVLFARSGMIDFECLTKKELRTHGDDEAFESSVVRLKKNQQRPEDVGAGPGSEFERSRKTFDISVEEKAPR